MFIKTLLLIVLGTITYLVFGWFVFDYIMGSYTDANTTHIAGFKKDANEFNTPFLVLSCTAYAILMVFINVYLTKTTSIARGTITGVVTGILVAIMANSYWLASSHFYNNVWVALADVAAAGITVGFLGFVTTALWIRMQQDSNQ